MILLNTVVDIGLYSFSAQFSLFFKINADLLEAY